MHRIILRCICECNSIILRNFHAILTHSKTTTEAKWEQRESNAINIESMNNKINVLYVCNWDVLHTLWLYTHFRVRTYFTCLCINRAKELANSKIIVTDLNIHGTVCTFFQKKIILFHFVSFGMQFTVYAFDGIQNIFEFVFIQFTCLRSAIVNGKTELKWYNAIESSYNFKSSRKTEWENVARFTNRSLKCS